LGKSDKVYGDDPEGGVVLGMKVGWWCEVGLIFFFLRDEFYDVAKVTIIHRKIWPNLVYKLNMEISFLKSLLHLWLPN
jgi:hypothetical protein